MASESTGHFRFGKYYFKTLFWFVVGGFLSALAIETILIPNQLIDGGMVGVAMMATHLSGKKMLLPYFLVLFNLPFVFLAYRSIGRHFVIQMLTAVLSFAFFLALFDAYSKWRDTPLEFHGETIEVIVLGGFIIGCGVGLIIRHGGSTDGTEIMGIIINRKRGFTVGQVILFVNFFIFALAGLVYQNWHTAFLSLMTYVVATKVMDAVIVGFEDTKSVMIISLKPQELSKILMDELGVGLTVMYGRGGFSGEAREILYIVVERLQLAELKEIVHREDPQAFIAVENLHEVINGRQQNSAHFL